MPSSSASHDSQDSHVFGPLLSIPEPSLVGLATSIRSGVLGAQTSSARVVARVAGSYNLVHILQLDDLKLVIRVPATGWGAGLTADAAQALESQAAALRLLQRETSIPVPSVLALDASCANPIGAPYICMSFVPGRSVSSAWFDPGCPSLDERRLRILSSVSEHVAQLSKFRFRKIGSPRLAEDGSFTVGPCYHWHENDDSSVRIVASGPFDSAAEYVREHTAEESTESTWGIAASKVVGATTPHLPFDDVPEPFVLADPDFDSQNIMVDDEGNVTGILDWDLVQTVPPCVGYASYPSWITRDWNPLMYGWPHLPDSENSPEELERYRSYYNQEMGSALGQGRGWVYTEKSHVREAVWNAVLSGTCRLEICRKLVQDAVGDTRDALDILYDLGTGYLSEEDWHSLKGRLERLIS